MHNLPHMLQGIEVLLLRQARCILCQHSLAAFFIKHKQCDTDQARLMDIQPASWIPQSISWAHELARSVLTGWALPTLPLCSCYWSGEKSAYRWAWDHRDPVIPQ